MGKLHDMAGGGAQDNSEILSLDDFTSAFDKKTQYAEFFEPKPETKTTEEIPENLIDPDGEGRADERPSDSVWSPESEDREPVNPERFARTGKHIAKFIDTGFDLTMSNLVAKGSGKSYHASDKDLEDLAEAWGELAEEKQWEMGPVPHLLLLNAAIYGPLVKTAIDDRRFMELHQRADEIEEKLKKQAQEIERLKNEQRAGNHTANTASVGAEG